MDALLIDVFQLKQGTPFTTPAMIFGIVGDKFWRIVEGFVKKLAKDLIVNYISDSKALKLCKKIQQLKHSYIGHQGYWHYISTIVRARQHLQAEEVLLVGQAQGL